MLDNMYQHITLGYKVHHNGILVYERKFRTSPPGFYRLNQAILAFDPFQGLPKK